MRNYQMLYQVYCHIPTTTDCGRLSAAGSLASIAPNRMPYTHRLSLATELSGDAIACQRVSLCVVLPLPHSHRADVVLR